MFYKHHSSSFVLLSAIILEFTKKLGVVVSCVYISANSYISVKSVHPQDIVKAKNKS